ncbi:MAG: substrate-binding domain-containing protein, partial [Armatimonadota bacterium]
RKYRVSSGTILSAIAILETQGVIVSRHGSGCYVSEPSENGVCNGGRTRCIGLICGSARADIFKRLQSGVDSMAARNGYSVILSCTNFSYDEEQAQVERLIEAGCEGIVVYPAVRTVDQAAKDYLNSRHLDFPIVLVDLALPTQKRSQVLLDNYRAGYDMTTFLLNKGHKRIAFLDYRTDETEFLHRSVMDRYRGYLDAMRDAGVPAEACDRWVLHEQMHEDATRSVAQLLIDWMEQIDRPTALIALEDNRAALTISIAQELGIRVPEDLEVVGFDDLPIGRIIRPHITTTRPDFARVGEVAVEILLQHIRKELDRPVTYMLPVPIKPREAVSLDCIVSDVRGRQAGEIDSDLHRL